MSAGATSGCARAGAGPDHDLPFTDRVIVTLVDLRFQLPHAALAELYGVDRSTVTRAVREVRPLLAARGFAVPGEPGVRLRTLADVFAYAAARGVELRLDGTEVQVRRPRAGKPGRRAFVSGKKKQNTKKATVITDEKGRTLWAGAFRPGRMHDQTAVRTEGIADLFSQFPAGQGQGRRRVPGPGQGVPGPGPGPAAEAEEGRRPRRKPPPTRTRTPPAVIGTDLRRARQRRAQAVAPPPAATSDDAKTSTRPTWPSPAWSPTAPPSGNHQPDNPPGQHAPTLIAHHVVRNRRELTRSFLESGTLLWYGHHDGNQGDAGGEVRGDLPASG